MSLRTSVATEIVLSDGDVVQLGVTTDVFQTGYSVMESRIVEMVRMSALKIVPNVTQTRNSPAGMDDVYLSKFLSSVFQMLFSIVEERLY